MPPPLPPQLITTILSHLLPPQPPLPPSLLATPLLDRLKYLPPSEDDTDAWISPIPSPSDAPSVISDRLHSLAVAHRVEAVAYAHDGEGVVARLSLRGEGSSPSQVPSTSTTHSQSHSQSSTGIDIMFAYEHTDQARGWVYHSSQIPLSEKGDANAHLAWTSSPDIPLTPPEHLEHQGGGAETSVEDYWKGFTPPTPTVDLPQADEDVEDAYWASYGGGPSGHATPARDRSMANLQALRGEAPVSAHDPADEQTRDINGDGIQHDHGFGHDRSERSQDQSQDQAQADAQPERVMCDMPTTANHVLDPLAALLATIPDSMSMSREAPAPSSPSREVSDLRDKVLGRIQASMRDVWAVYTRDAEARPESLEEKALGWLRIGRAVIDGKELYGLSGDEVVVKAKMDVLKEMYVVVAPAPARRESGEIEVDAHADGFWRYVERTIKMPMVPGSANDDGMTQETYWE